MKQQLLIWILCIFGTVYGYGLEEVTSANGGQRLKSFLERFEKSDLDGNGILTVDEMHAYLDTKIKDGAQSDPTPTKTINLKKLKGLKSRAYLNALYMETNGAADANADGTLTKVELLEYILSQRKVINDKGEIVPAPIVPTPIVPAPIVPAPIVPAPKAEAIE